jgi:hypothetical protein
LSFSSHSSTSFLIHWLPCLKELSWAILSLSGYSSKL